MKSRYQYVAFRTDASTLIGTGHVVRCLTLANELRKHGVISHFVCRAHVGHWAETIKAEGHQVTLLPVDQKVVSRRGNVSRYASWLGADWSEDAKYTIYAVNEFSPTWIVVDHYAIDARWERIAKSATQARIMVIDGLANREHDCDLLLDQTFSPGGERRWDGLVPQSCMRFAGPRFALLRPEFVAMRRSLRQRDGSVRRIFIAFGGVDQPNATLTALEALSELKWTGIAVDVVIGNANPHRTALQAKCRQLENVSLHIQPDNIAELMANADLAISGGGMMLLEQCYLCLPSIVVSIAENQIGPAQSLHALGAVNYIGNFGVTTRDFIKQAVLPLLNEESRLKKMQLVAGNLMTPSDVSICDILLGDS